ncbi:MAG TPA: SIS domain-containing protein [Candidatus Limnocylindria bacterium]
MIPAIRALPREPDAHVEPESDYGPSLRTALERRADVYLRALPELARSEDLARCAHLLVHTLRHDGKILVAGNGGSAAEAQHFAAELVGRFSRERCGYPVMALTTDTSILTAIANDYAYADVFARQVEAHGRPGDLLLLFTTSGESENIVRAAHAARRRAMTVVTLTGSRRSRVGRCADVVVRMPTCETPVVQELQMALTHALCGIVEDALAEEDEA